MLNKPEFIIFSLIGTLIVGALLYFLPIISSRSSAVEQTARAFILLQGDNLEELEALFSKEALSSEDWSAAISTFSACRSNWGRAKSIGNATYSHSSKLVSDQGSTSTRGVTDVVNTQVTYDQATTRYQIEFVQNSEAVRIQSVSGTGICNGQPYSFVFGA